MTIKFSDITGGGIPYGNTAGRPANPGVGKLYSNGELQRLELYTGATYGWQNIVAETPGVTGYTGTVLETNTTNTINITGTNFASGATATLVGNDGTEYVASTTTVNNLTAITAVFGSLPANKEPYDIRVTNPSNLYGVYYDILTVNDKPAWQTASGSLGTVNELTSVSFTVAATDEENNTITYSSTNLPSWLTLNSSTGQITGISPDSEADTTYTFDVIASDGINASTSRSFSITVLNNLARVAEILVVAGGGGGGAQVGGGGGAGGLIYSSSYGFTSGSKTLTVGAGGSGSSSTARQPGNYGGNSVLGSLIAIGGGGGGAHDNTLRPSGGNDGIEGGLGRPGGCGGGGGGDTSSIGRSGGASTQSSYSGATSYGNSGGTGRGGNWAGGGGGGAGGAGQASPASSTGGVGGDGIQFSITGTAQYYAAGGGGCYNNSGGTTGRASGIGGAGNGDTPNADRDAVANTGSGGGGCRDIGSSGNGSAGVVIIAYPNTKPALTISGGLTYDQPTRSGYRVYRFTAGTGTITF